jgi:hypothetical protein
MAAAPRLNYLPQYIFSRDIFCDKIVVAVLEMIYFRVYVDENIM